MSLVHLPIDDYISEIQDLLSVHQNLVITAAPGAGKTTRLPPALTKIFKGKVLVLEPRRMAAIAAAHRIAEKQAFSLGEEIGYQVRFANKSSNKTRLLFMTEALLARQMLDDPELNGVDAVILDEFHERSAHVDLALGLLKELQELGRDIKIIVMSATLEAEKISEYLNSCPIVSVPGKLFPLEIKLQKNAQSLNTLPAFYDNLVQTIKEAQTQTAKDILVFLPGVGEIERSKERLSDWADQKNIELVILHGSLAIEDQRRALTKGNRQRVILTTNVAESSVTVDGVDTVIDSGLSKSMRLDHRTGFSRLELGRISLSSATQRAGRAARQFPGVCYRLWSRHDELAFSKGDIAEIQRIDLSESLLFLSAQGVTDFTSFSWFETPPLAALQSATRYLVLAGALDSSKKITPLGRKLLHFPLPVRLAKLVLLGQAAQDLEFACDAAALLQERDVLFKNSASHFLGDNLENDLAPRLEALSSFRKNKRAPREFNHGALQTVEQAAQQIQRLGRNLSTEIENTPKNADEIILRAFADRLCRRRGSSEKALMVGGRGVKLNPESLVKKSEFFIALNGIDGHEAETVISLAWGFEKDFILKTFSNKIQKSIDVVFSEEKGQFLKREYRSLYGLALDEPRLTPASASEIAERLPEILTSRFNLILKENEELQRWWSRWSFLKSRGTDLEISLNFEEEPLIKEAFAQASMGETKISDVVGKDLVFFFENAFPIEIVEFLKQHLPAKVTVPSGSQIPVHYPTDKPPYLEVRIQEVFGLGQTPRVLKNSLPITFHLLGPNFRPVQVTSDLESFWKNGYPEVRKELRLKYPKHQWPEDPAEGTPEAKGRRRFT